MATKRVRKTVDNSLRKYKAFNRSTGESVEGVGVDLLDPVSTWMGRGHRVDMVPLSEHNKLIRELNKLPPDPWSHQ